MRRSLAPSQRKDGMKNDNGVMGGRLSMSSLDALKASLGARPVRPPIQPDRNINPLSSSSSLSSLVSKPFKVPTGCVVTERTLELRKTKRLGPPKNFQMIKPGDLSGLIRVSGMVSMPISEEEPEDEQMPTSTANLPPFEPLVLWIDPNDPEIKIEVIPELACKLRPHQREGVQFLFECTMGLRGFDGQGCILADDMGLGKTLMSITIMWTLLNQGFKKGESAVRKVIIACPTSLVGNWDNEIRKWVGDKCPTFAVKTDPKKMIKTFLQHRGKGVLIISYETQRLYSKLFESTLKPLSTNIGGNCCDLLICDEAHKLKNAESGMAKSLSLLPAKKRVMLSGTPMQNELTEFFNMVNFCNPGVLGTLSEFRRRYERPILASREPDALESEIEEAAKLQKELSTIVNEFILKRGNILNAQHLPPKLVQFVCCRPTPLQLQLYETLLNSKEIRHIKEGKQTNTLNSIRQLINICSHPQLVWDTYCRKMASNEEIDEDLKALVAILPASIKSALTTPTAAPNTSSATRLPMKAPGMMKPTATSSAGSGVGRIDPELSGKMATLFKMMATMRILKSSERIVIVSNYTQTLDLIEKLCKQCTWPFLRLDGTISSNKRTQLVEEFNNPHSHCFAFLLSSKAGGCGINLIGANRLVLFDPDWNPASDKQAAGRIWREGQKRRCFIYRFMSTGTIEEKIIQRQLNKEGLADIVDDKEQVNCISTDELKQLFTVRSLETHSDTHDTLKCKRCTHLIQRKASGKSSKKMSRRQIEACLEYLDRFEQYLVQESMAYQRRERKRLQDVQSAGIQGEEAERDAMICPVLPFADKFEVLRVSLREEMFSNLTAYSRKQREVFVAVEDAFQEARKWKDGVAAAAVGGSAAGKENTMAMSSDMEGYQQPSAVVDHRLVTLFAPTFSVYSEFIKQWTELVPSLVSLVDVVSNAGEEAPLCPPCAQSEQESAVNGASTGDAPPPTTFVEQVGCPDDTDINQWSHHSTVLSCDDDLLCSAFADTEDTYISFVFGLEVNFSLLELREAQMRDEVERKKEEQRLALLELNKKRQRLREGKAEEGSGDEDENMDGEGEQIDMQIGKTGSKKKEGPKSKVGRGRPRKNQSEGDGDGDGKHGEGTSKKKKKKTNHPDEEEVVLMSLADDDIEEVVDDMDEEEEEEGEEEEELEHEVDELCDVFAEDGIEEARRRDSSRTSQPMTVEIEHGMKPKAPKNKSADLSASHAKKGKLKKNNDEQPASHALAASIPCSEYILTDALRNRMQRTDPLLLADLQHLDKLHHKQKLQGCITTFHAFWQALKKFNNNWRALLVDGDAVELFVRTPGLKPANYAKYEHLVDYFVGEEELLWYFHWQARAVQKMEVSEFVRGLLQGYRPSSSAPHAPCVAKDEGWDAGEDGEDDGEGGAVMLNPRRAKKAPVLADSDDDTNSPHQKQQTSSPSGQSTGEYFLCDEEEDVCLSPGARGVVESKKSASSRGGNSQDTASSGRSSGSSAKCEWTCDYCTLINAAGAKKCAACMQKRRK